MYCLENLYDAITFSDSEYPHLIEDIILKTDSLIQSIIRLRKEYQKNNSLPLFEFNSDMENLQSLLDIVEDEILKFGKPVTVSKSYQKIDIEKMKLDKEAWIDLGLDEWEEEGLLK